MTAMRALEDHELAAVETVKVLNDTHYKTLDALEDLLRVHGEHLTHGCECTSVNEKGERVCRGTILLFGQVVFTLRKPSPDSATALRYSKEYIEYVKNGKGKYCKK